LFLTVQDLKELHLEGRAQVVTGTFPACWEVEIMGIVEQPYEVFVRYVSMRELEGVVGALCRECADFNLNSIRRRAFSIRLPYSDGMSLGFKGSQEGAPVSALE
jgi:hypothetical protein